MPAKGYSPLRRWLRTERARAHRMAIAGDEETVADLRPNKAPAREVADRAWRMTFRPPPA